MPLIILLTDNTAAHEVALEGPVSGGRFTAKKLRLGAQSIDLAVELNINQNPWLNSAPGGPDRFMFVKPAGSLGIEFESSIAWTTASSLFGLEFSSAKGVTATLFVRIAADNENPIDPAIELRVCGHCKLSGGGTVAHIGACVSIAFDELPTVFPALPTAYIELPDIGWRLPRLPFGRGFAISNPFQNPFPATSFDLPPLNGRISWRSLSVAVSATEAVFKIQGLTIAVGNQSIEGNVDIKLKDDQVTIERIELTRPSITLPAPLPKWFFDGDCLMLDGTEKELNSILKILAPELDLFRLTDDRFHWTVRILRGDAGLEEVRFDVTPTTPQSLELPGLKIDLKAGTVFHLVFRQPEDLPQRVWLGMSPSVGSDFTASLPFNWGRDDSRELMPSDDSKALLSLKVTTKAAFTLVVASFKRDGKREFFKKTLAVLKTLAIDHADESCRPTPDPLTSLDGSEIQDPVLDGSLLKSLKLPFLRDEASPITQFVSIEDVTNPVVSIPNHTISTKITLAVTVGTLKLKGAIDLTLDWETMSFGVKHDKGIEFKLESDFKDKELFGLKWSFERAPGVNPDFVLLTQASNYSFKQAPGSRFVLGFDRATNGSPIQFEVKDFSLASKGISLNAAVMNTPAKLQALNTEFRFTEGSIQIRDN